MTLTPPIYDDRTPEQFAAKLRELLRSNLPGQRTLKPLAGDSGEALIRVFSHFCGILVDRLNQAPYKNLLAFLNLQGVSLTPARAARVPLTFQLTPQHAGYVKVPAHTQVAALPEAGEEKPVLFETERDFTVTSAQLAFAGTQTGTEDRFSDHSLLLQPGGLLQCASSKAVAAFRSQTPVEHLLYFGFDLPLPLAALQELRLKLQVVAAAEPSPRMWFEWQVQSGAHRLSLTPAKDDTNGLCQSGEVVFHNLPEVAVTDLSGRKGRWLICRLTLPLGTAPEDLPVAALPSLSGVQVTNVFARQTSPLDAALLNQAALDVSKDFFPFGERPKFADALYLTAEEAFALPSTSVTLHFKMANAEQEAMGGTPPQVRALSVRLLWEISSGGNWIELGVSESGRESNEETTGFSDSTKAFTHSGTVTFRVPPGAAPASLGGLKQVWLRVRLAGGDYGRETHYEKSHDGAVTVVPASFSPPCFHSVSVDYNLQIVSASPPVVAYNNFTYFPVEGAAAAVPLFRAPSDPLAWYFLGFDRLSGLGAGSLSLYVGVAPPGDQKTWCDLSGPEPVVLWEYSNGPAWKTLPVRDGSDGLTHSGILEFLVPSDFAATSRFGRDLHWVRFRMRDQTPYEPWLHRLSLNTIMATQSLSLASEVMGTSNGTGGQSFVTLRAPILESQQVEVREPIMPAPEERDAIVLAEGPDAIREAVNVKTGARAKEVWVRWHEVPDFNASSGSDRHYTIDRTAGEITFGDGEKGRIPPPLNRNIVMAHYRTGGGLNGNRQANSIVQLKSAIPYVEKVTNLEPATGGADRETYDALLRRAPRQIRHNWRAVTSLDFEDLALLASPDVARARCLPMRDLSTQPGAGRQRPGVASLIIVPASSSSGSNAPVPSVELLGQVRDFLDARRPAEADLLISGPEYVPIQVETEITISADETPGEVESAARDAITQFLHPITGNRFGDGWDFGQQPARSDFFPLLESLPGVEHVRELQITLVKPEGDTDLSDHFLICAAPPQVTATWET